MGLWSRYVFPRGMDWTMRQPEIERLRTETLADVSGEVLEIGFGTGLNLERYPDRVKRISTVDPHPGMAGLAARRIAASKIEVERRVLSSERLPFEDEQFDSVVSTWTLCSIPDVNAALGELRRVLKPGGRFFLIEHGLSPDPKVRRWQHRMNGLQMKIADGCRLDREIDKIVLSQGFEFITLKQFYQEKARPTVGFTTQGVAVKA